MKTVSKKISSHVGDVAITYAAGSRPGPTAVFLHGWGSSSRIWQQTVSELPYASVTIDLPGFGDSTVPNQSLKLLDYTAVVETVIDEMELTEVVLVGHSFGGQIATALAAEQPDWLRGLVLVASASLRETEEPLLSLVGRWVSPLFRLPLVRRLRPLLYRLIGADEPPRDPALRETMREILRADQSDKLKDITVPTLVVWGNQDTTTPLEEGQEIASSIGSATLSVFSGGHFIFIDQPTRFNDQLTTFMSQLSN